MVPVVEEMYTIQEAEPEIGVDAHRLRYYERIGLLPSMERGDYGWRVDSKEDLGWIYWLRLLRKTGLSIRTMKRYVEITRAGDHTLDERCALLQEHCNSLQEHLKPLDQKVEFDQVPRSGLRISKLWSM